MATGLHRYDIELTDRVTHEKSIIYTIHALPGYTEAQFLEDVEKYGTAKTKMKVRCGTIKIYEHPTSDM